MKVSHKTICVNCMIWTLLTYIRSPNWDYHCELLRLVFCFHNALPSPDWSNLFEPSRNSLYCTCLIMTRFFSASSEKYKSMKVYRLTFHYGKGILILWFGWGGGGRGYKRVHHFGNRESSKGLINERKIWKQKRASHVQQHCCIALSSLS